MDGERYDLGNGFSLFYDWNNVIPFFDNLSPEMTEKIKQLIWNQAFERSTDFMSCGKNNEHRFFLIKNPSLKVSYIEREHSWIVYSIVYHES